MLVIRCKNCNKQLESHPTKTRSCRCENFTSIRGTNISGNNLSLVEIIVNTTQNPQNSSLSKKDLEFQEKRKQRKVRKLDFEER